MRIFASFVDTDAVVGVFHHSAVNVVNNAPGNVEMEEAMPTKHAP
jgi:hypothetical protein